MYINLYLLKSNYDFETAFENKEIIKGEEYDYIVSSNGGKTLPKWFESVENNIIDDKNIEEIKNKLKPTASNSLLILKNHAGKRFIITFGQGHSKIEDKFIEDTFGKKICMILSDKNKAKFLSVTNKEIGTKGKSSQTHIQRTGNFNDFGLVGENNYLKNLKVRIGKGGEYFNEKSIIVEGGKNCKFKMGNDKSINDVLDEALELYSEEIHDEYLKDIYDNIKEIKKPENFDLNDMDLNIIYIDHNISHDEIVEIETIEVKNKSKKLFEIDLSHEFEDILRLLKNSSEIDYENITTEEIFKLKLIYKNSNGDEVRKEEVKNSICYEFEERENSNEKIIYMNGQYFAISNNYLNKIDVEINAIENFSFENINIPDIININTEEEFNKRFAINKDLHLFDRKLIHFAGNKFEFCDILNKEEKEILHVKGKGSNGISSSECEHWTHQLINGREISLEYADTVLDKIRGMENCKDIFNDKREFEDFLKEATFGLVSFTKNSKSLIDFPLFGKIAFYNLIKRANQGNIKLKYYNFYKE